MVKNLKEFLKKHQNEMARVHAYLQRLKTESKSRGNQINTMKE